MAINLEQEIPKMTWKQFKGKLQSYRVGSTKQDNSPIGLYQDKYGALRHVESQHLAREKDILDILKLTDTYRRPELVFVTDYEAPASGGNYIRGIVKELGCDPYTGEPVKEVSNRSLAEIVIKVGAEQGYSDSEMEDFFFSGE